MRGFCEIHRKFLLQNVSWDVPWDNKSKIASNQPPAACNLASPLAPDSPNFQFDNALHYTSRLAAALGPDEVSEELDAEAGGAGLV